MPHTHAGDSQLRSSHPTDSERPAATRSLKSVVAAAYASAIAMGLTLPPSASAASDKEKCYGISKAGQNDCANMSATHACAGQTKWDRMLDDYRYVAAGTCKSLGGESESEARRAASAIESSMHFSDQAIQLFDFAERMYPQFFPKRQKTQLLPPFSYRHYPATGTYLGVVTQAGSDLASGGVYVMGGSLGPNVQHVGPLSAIFTPVDSTGSLTSQDFGTTTVQLSIRRSTTVNRAFLFLADLGTTSGTDPSVGAGLVRTHPRLPKTWPDWATMQSYGVAAVIASKSVRTGGGHAGGVGSGGTPVSAYWSNHVTSNGEDDVAMLKSLAQQIRSSMNVQEIVLAGHGMGGTMVNRIWCEAPATFDAYLSFAGPPAAQLAAGANNCDAKASARPYWGIVAANDPVLQNGGRWDAASWQVSPAIAQSIGTLSLVNATLAGEWSHFAWKVKALCGETAKLADAVSTVAMDEWRYCKGNLRLTRLRDAGHDLASMNQQAGTSPFEMAMQLLAERQP